MLNFFLLRLREIILSLNRLQIKSTFLRLLKKSISLKCKSITSTESLFRNSIFFNNLSLFKLDIRLISRLAYNKKFESGIFNLCSGNTLSILDLSKILQSITLEKFSFKPIIKELTQTNNLSSEYFNYSNEKVKKYGFEIKNDIKDKLINILNITNKFYSSEK